MKLKKLLLINVSNPNKNETNGETKSHQKGMLNPLKCSYNIHGFSAKISCQAPLSLI